MVLMCCCRREADGLESVNIIKYYLQSPQFLQLYLQFSKFFSVGDVRAGNHTKPVCASEGSLITTYAESPTPHQNRRYQ